MKIIHLDQSGPDWHRWRQMGLGGSDAPVIMGDSPFMDLPTLRAVKAGEAPEVEERVSASYPVKRGKRLEPLACNAYQERTGLRGGPACVIHDQYPWLRASLDFLSEDAQRAAEIKCPMGLAQHRLALAGQADPKYKAQLQHQLLVTGFPCMDFVSFTDSPLFRAEDRLAVVPVEADPEYQDELFRRERLEWERTNPDWKGLH